MTKQNKKKMGYNQYEKLLVLAHKKSDVLAERLQALQSYVVSYIEYCNDNVKFNDWINQQIIKEQDKIQQEKEQVNEEI